MNFFINPIRALLLLADIQRHNKRLGAKLKTMNTVKKINKSVFAGGLEGERMSRRSRAQRILREQNYSI